MYLLTRTVLAVILELCRTTPMCVHSMDPHIEQRQIHANPCLYKGFITVRGWGKVSYEAVVNGLLYYLMKFTDGFIKLILLMFTIEKYYFTT